MRISMTVASAMPRKFSGVAPCPTMMPNSLAAARSTVSRPIVGFTIPRRRGAASMISREQPRLAFAAQLVISVAKEDVGSLVVRIEYVAGPAGTQPHGGFSFRSCEEHVDDDVRGAAKRHGGGRASRADAHDAVLEAGAV